MFDYVYDFLSILAGKESFNRIRQIILFGSFARGNPREDSDIDLFIDVHKDDKENVSDDVKESLNEFEIKAKESWRLKGIENQLQVIIDSIEEERWKEMRREIASYGIVLYSRYHGKPSKEKHCVLIEYSLDGLKQKEKMRFIRRVSGYSVKKGRKKYSFQGALSKFNADKIANAVLVPIENYRELSRLFKKAGIKVKTREFWM